MNKTPNIWHSRNIILFLSISDLKLKYRGTTFGFIWSILEPLAQLAILYAVFSAIRPTEGDFIVYLFIGLIMIHLFSRATSQSLNSLIIKKPLLLSLNIQKAIFPLSIVATNIYMFAIELGIFFTFFAFLGSGVSISFIIFPIIVGLLIIFTIGVSFLLSIIRMYFKDIQSFWGIITVSWIFITPVFWKVDDMAPEFARVFLLNPLALLMEMAHQVLLFNEIPSSGDFIYATASSFLFLIAGWYIFSKLEKKVVDNL